MQKLHDLKCRALSLAILAFAALITTMGNYCSAEETRPNILFAIADDWGWPHAGAYGHDDRIKSTINHSRLTCLSEG
jgi:hypothetical protein